MAEITPMKRQYNEIKEQYQDCLLFFRLGDFYEMFDDDAKLASRELDLALTTRDRNKPDEERTPMCGIPYHAAEGYIARLISKGYKVAICEQTEDPAQAKGIVRREVIRVISPGTVTESSMLEEGRSNYLAALTLEGDASGLAFCDISTGEFCCAAFSQNGLSHAMNELGRFSPREVLLSAPALDCKPLTDFLRGKLNALLEPGSEGFAYARAEQRIRAQFGFKDMAECGLDELPQAVQAAGALLDYIAQTQKFDMGHINRMDLFFGGKYMELDWQTRRSLELTESLRDREKRGSLLWVLDKTKTPMGGRLLRSWVERPLLSAVAINRRLNAVSELYGDNMRRGELILALREVGDMQRLVGRAVYGTASARDLRSLGNFAHVLPQLKELLQGVHSQELKALAEMDALEDVAFQIDRAIVDEPPFSVREGGMLRTGYSEEVDKLRRLRDNGAQMLKELEERERERTGIKKLKLGYNKVFGYYIDVPKSAGEVELPAEYMRKQTLVSNERYFTPELKELETDLLTARERICQLEYQYFDQLRQWIAAQVDRIKASAEALARLDVFCALAEVAVKNNYTCPQVDASRSLEIIQGRHPVVEQSMKNVLFVPNDSYLNDSEDRVAIITGPNMAGKSTYMRQTALIVLMAQIGSFVPAKSATIGIVDRVFTRIGASDDLASGQSTFMVEMSEMAQILKDASPASLLILDEIGRGTSTYDGMAIARAVLEYCADKRRLGAKTMFATHYHELSALEGELEGVRNYNISAKKQGGTLVFLRKILPGAADDSYGIEVAKLAGLPEAVISKAKGYLKDLEADGLPAPQSQPRQDQISMADMGADQVRRQLLSTDINSLTPLEAMNLLFELQRKARS